MQNTHESTGLLVSWTRAEGGLNRGKFCYRFCIRISLGNPGPRQTARSPGLGLRTCRLGRDSDRRVNPLSDPSFRDSPSTTIELPLRMIPSSWQTLSSYIESAQWQWKLQGILHSLNLTPGPRPEQDRSSRMVYNGDIYSLSPVKTTTRQQYGRSDCHQHQVRSRVAGG